MNLAQLNDEQLIVKVREEDSQLYAEIVRRYNRKLLGYIRYLANNSNDAEDILQDVLIKAYKNLYDFNVHKKFSSWLYRIAHNEAVNYIKKQARERSFLVDSTEEIIGHHDLANDIDRKLLKKQLTEYINRLGLRYREPIILYYFEAKSYEEISDILRVPVNTVGTLIHRGKDLLKKIMKSEKI